MNSVSDITSVDPVRRNSVPSPFVIDFAGQRARRMGYLVFDGNCSHDIALLDLTFEVCNNWLGTTVYERVRLALAEDSKTVIPLNNASAPACRGTSSMLYDSIFVFAGAEIDTCNAASAWLRKHWRHGTRVCGVAGGAFALARSGIVEGKLCTTHWSECDRFAAEFPSVQVSYRTVEQHENVWTCAGGVSSIDLALRIIENDLGQEIANEISEYLVFTRTENEQDQRCPLRIKLRTNNRAVLSAVEQMYQNVEEPLAREELARRSGIGVRQLERLFKDKLNKSIAKYYSMVRLEKAYVLLTSTNWTVLEVSISCGFKTSSHFATVFKTRYGVLPSQLRR